MVAVTLLTVLSPGYAWEAAAGKGGHGEEKSRIDPHGPEDHERSKLPAGEQDQAPHDLHGCAGHMLGHLVAIDGANGPCLLKSRDVAIARYPSASASQYLDVLDHPPRIAVLA